MRQAVNKKPGSVVVSGSFCILTMGGFATLAQCWEAFDQQMKADVGTKTAKDYISLWGKPAKYSVLENGGEVVPEPR
jgi:hypothetical protein